RCLCAQRGGVPHHRSAFQERSTGSRRERTWTYEGKCEKKNLRRKIDRSSLLPSSATCFSFSPRSRTLAYTPRPMPVPADGVGNPLAVFASLWRHRDLVWQMTKREVVGRYRGSVLGLLWSFVHPLVMLAIYTFVFGVVLQARWQTEEEGLGFATVLF